MDRPDYLVKYMFDWESLDVVISGRSALDSKFFLGPVVNDDTVENFLVGYGIDRDDSVARAELFGNFQEAIQFIKRSFLLEGDTAGLDIRIPSSILMITDISDLFLMATRDNSEYSEEEMLWAELLLKVMHTILHVDKDLRTNYFNAIQTQIFDRFYKYIHRLDEELFLATSENSPMRISLVDFETKSKKSRDSVIIKLLHKAENVAEELFDRVGVRIITKSRFDALRVVRFLSDQHVVIPHNIKPSRSVNNLVNTEKFRDIYSQLVKDSIRKDLSEEEFLTQIDLALVKLRESADESEHNVHTSSKYQSIQFTCRQLIKYKNPFMHEFSVLRKSAKKDKENALAKKILAMDYSLVARDIKFFYPYEVQIVDEGSHRINTEGEASHLEYKKSQTQAAMKRLFKSLIKYHDLKV
jgi:uncharacterized protein (TIGR04562 family)